MRKGLVIIFAICGSVLNAQSGFFKARLDTFQILIGEAMHLELSAELPSREAYQWPVLDTLSQVVILESGALDTLDESAGLKLQQTLTITSFDTGVVTIPALPLKQGDKTWLTEERKIAVALPESGQKEDYFDIKGLLNVKRPWYWYLWFLIPVLVLALLVWVWQKYRRREPRSTVSKEPAVPPHLEAYQALDELESEKLWQNGKYKRYYSQLIDILRRFLARRYGMKTMESTADELALKTQKLSLPQDFTEEYRRVLQTSALVKYAKAKPLAAENEHALGLTRKFIEFCAPQSETEENKQRELSKS